MFLQYVDKFYCVLWISWIRDINSGWLFRNLGSWDQLKSGRIPGLSPILASISLTLNKRIPSTMQYCMYTQVALGGVINWAAIAEMRFRVQTDAGVAEIFTHTYFNCIFQSLLSKNVWGGFCWRKNMFEKKGKCDIFWRAIFCRSVLADFRWRVAELSG